MRSAGRFYLIVKPDHDSAEDRMGFEQNMERRNGSFSIYIKLATLIFGEEPLQTPRNNRLVGILHIDVFRKTSRSKVRGMKIDILGHTRGFQIC